jgi:hypothetical protein
MFKLVGPLPLPVAFEDLARLTFGAGATELHFPELISTSLFKRI